MLRAVLEETGNRLPGCEAAVLVGHDGMVVDKWAAETGPPVEELAAELTPLLRAVEMLSRNTDGGGFREILVRLNSWSCLMQPVNDETFVVLVARHEAFPGRIRFEAARAVSQIEAELR
jgi:predicted regulator of Ras-like GTPase activity (Roadblock/LC7/MglB family)